MSSMIDKIKNNKFSIKSIASFILYTILFWLLIGYIVLPICNTFVQAFQSDGRFSLDVLKLPLAFIGKRVPPTNPVLPLIPITKISSASLVNVAR